MPVNDKLIIAGREFTSRLMVGTGKYADFQQMVKATVAAFGRLDVLVPEQLADRRHGAEPRGGQQVVEDGLDLHLQRQHRVAQIMRGPHREAVARS